MNKTISNLVYFDVFNHPLSLSELCELTGLESVEVQQNLELLVANNLAFNLDGYFSLQNDDSILINRLRNESRAKKFVHQANKKAKLISKFPYVSGVYISGSLSKGVMSMDGDVDYFIITKENRLWVARTLLILYKKIILFNSRKYFCVNYFIDENHLEIENKNIFTAIELSTLVPMYNQSLYNKLIRSNAWSEKYSNVLKSKLPLSLSTVRRSWLKRLSEPLFNTKLGDVLERKSMNWTLKKWKSKFPHLSDAEFEIAMKSSKNVSKHHPSNFQKIVLSKYNNKMDSIDLLIKKRA